MWTVFEVAVNLFQGFLMIYFISRCLPDAKRPHWGWDVLFEALCGGFLTLYLFFPWPIQTDNLVFVFPLLYCWVTGRGAWAQRVLWTLVLAAFFLAVADISFAVLKWVLGVDYEQLMAYTSIHLTYMLTTNVLLFLLASAIPRIAGRSGNGALSLSALSLFFASLVLQLVIAELLFSYQLRKESQDPSFAVISVCALALMVITILLYELISQSVMKRRQAEMTLQMMEMGRQHNQDIQSMYSEMIAAQHDMRHRIAAAEELLREGNAPSDRQARELLSGVQTVPQPFITGCALMDAVLTAKKAVMDQNGIVFRYQPYPLSRLPIPETDFCMVISNLLDNAIEAIQRMDRKSDDPPAVSLSFARSWDMFYIRCENPFDPATLRLHGGQLLSSKENTRLHGFGTRYIRKTCESAGGQCKFVQEENTFIAELILPDHASSDEKSL